MGRGAVLELLAALGLRSVIGWHRIRFRFGEIEATFVTEARSSAARGRAGVGAGAHRRSCIPGETGQGRALQPGEILKAPVGCWGLGRGDRGRGRAYVLGREEAGSVLGRRDGRRGDAERPCGPESLRQTRGANGWCLAPIRGAGPSGCYGRPGRSVNCSRVAPIGSDSGMT